MNSSTRCWVGIHLIHVWSGVGVRMYTGLLIRGHFWADLGSRPLVWAFIKSSPNVNLILVKAGSLWVLIYLLVSPSLSTGQSNIFDREKWSIFDENFELFKFSVLNFPNFNFTLQVFCHIIMINIKFWSIIMIFCRRYGILNNAIIANCFKIISTAS